ncbi:CD209 antigen-like protein E [Clinocottus analis]|uniref:CD209 antigen-like protein E n=1 Tax=Clinocottus analis TaxID=304258 RepID=UPI0035C0B44B
MARFIHKEQSEMDDVNVPDAKTDAKTDAQRDGGGTAAVSGRKLFRVVAVSFGLLCILQAALNISLRLAFYSSSAKMPDFQAIIKNLTEEREDLKRKLSAFDHYLQPGWVYFYPSFYYISSNQMSWQESRADCLERGADLIIINSKEEQEFANRFQRHTWIGLTDIETEGKWKWVDGTALNTSFWNAGEPNGRHNENCVEMSKLDKENNWCDQSCDDINFWICEKVVAP